MTGPSEGLPGGPVFFPRDLGKFSSVTEITPTTEMITFVEGKLRTKAQGTNQTVDVGVADSVQAKHFTVVG